jgi:cytochrome c
LKLNVILAAAALTTILAQAATAQDAAPPAAPAAAPAAGPGDPVHGAVIFKQCLLCHTNVQGKNKIGPSLWGVVGRHSATISDYTYSPAMKAADKVWDEATLNIYLTKPQAMVPGTKMTFFGLPKEQDRLDVIAYLKTLK